MKKWVATYILFVSCIAFALSGKANSCNGTIFLKNVKTPLPPKATEFKATKFLPKQPARQDQQPYEFCRSLVHAGITGCPSVVPFITEERPDLFTCTGTFYAALVPNAAILKGYLLHLFPSHYFW